MGCVLALAVSGAQRAAACTCNPAAHALVPQPFPADAALWVVSGRPESTRLESGDGEELLDLSIGARLEQSGLCGKPLSALLPGEPLDGGRYLLRPAEVVPGGVLYAGDAAKIVEPSPRSVPRAVELVVEVQRVAHELGSYGTCAEPLLLDDRTTSSELTVHVVASEPAFLVVASTLTDSRAGKLPSWQVNTDARGAPRAEVTLYASWPDGASDCVQLTVHDLRGDQVLSDEYCLAVGDTESRSHLAELRVAGEEPSRPAGGCSAAGRAGSRGWWMLTALVTLAALRRRRVLSLLPGLAAACGDTRDVAPDPARVLRPGDELVCDPGWAACSLERVCSDLQGGRHCGECGNDCAGGACLDGVCGEQPAVVFESPEQICGLASNGRDLAVLACDGTVSALLEDEPQGIGLAGAYSYELAMTDGFVYFLDGRSYLLRASIDGADVSHVPVGRDPVHSLVATERGAYWLSGDSDQPERDLLFLSADSERRTLLASAGSRPLVRDGERVCTVVREPSTLECWTGTTRESWPVPVLDPMARLALTGSVGWSCSGDGLQRFDLNSDTALMPVADSCVRVVSRDGVLALFGAHQHLSTMDTRDPAARPHPIASPGYPQGLVIAGERACWFDDVRVLCATMAL